jgi:hypothetical protein
MEGSKMRIGYIKAKLPQTLDELVVALCRDYERRAAALSSDGVSTRTKVEFRYLNYKIADAVGELVERELVPVFIREIGDRVGYSASAVVCMSESTYKSKKASAKVNIARKLHFCD